MSFHLCVLWNNLFTVKSLYCCNKLFLRNVERHCTETFGKIVDFCSSVSLHNIIRHVMCGLLRHFMLEVQVWSLIRMDTPTCDAVQSVSVFVIGPSGLYCFILKKKKQKLPFPSKIHWSQLKNSDCCALVETWTVVWLYLHLLYRPLYGHKCYCSWYDLLINIFVEPLSCPVLPLHPAVGGSADVHPGVVLEVFRCSPPAVGPRLHHGGVGPVLQPCRHSGQTHGHLRTAHTRQVQKDTWNQV